MNPKITVKLVLEGERSHVEDISAIARQYFDVVEEGKMQPIHLRPGIVRHVLRIIPPPAQEIEGRAA